MSLQALVHVWDTKGLTAEEKLLLIFIADFGDLGYSHCPEWIGMGDFIGGTFQDACRVANQLTEKGFIRWGNSEDDTEHLFWIVYDGPYFPPIDLSKEPGGRSARVRALLERDGPGCRYCSAKVAEYHVDHFVPKSRGGPDKLHNLVLACAPCNMTKGARMPELFLYNRPELYQSILAALEAHAG